jgi:hypothetical protein
MARRVYGAVPPAGPVFGRLATGYTVAGCDPDHASEVLGDD